MSICVRRKCLSRWTDRFFWTGNFLNYSSMIFDDWQELFLSSFLSSARWTSAQGNVIRSTTTTNIDHLSDRSDTEISFPVQLVCNSLSNWLNLVENENENERERFDAWASCYSFRLMITITFRVSRTRSLLNESLSLFPASNIFRILRTWSDGHSSVDRQGNWLRSVHPRRIFITHIKFHWCLFQRIRSIDGEMSSAFMNVTKGSKRFIIHLPAKFFPCTSTPINGDASGSDFSFEYLNKLTWYDVVCVCVCAYLTYIE